MRITIRTTIPAPPRVVWEDLRDISTHVEWMADAEAIHFLSSQHEGVGTQFECVTRIGIIALRDLLEVTEWEPSHALGIRHEGAVRGVGVFTLKRGRPGTTRFRWRERLHFPWWLGGPIGALVAYPIFRHIWRGNLRRLAARFE